MEHAVRFELTMSALQADALDLAWLCVREKQNPESRSQSESRIQNPEFRIQNKKLKAGFSLSFWLLDSDS
jgi:hypothetical protein